MGDVKQLPHATHDLNRLGHQSVTNFGANLVSGLLFPRHKLILFGDPLVIVVPERVALLLLAALACRSPVAEQGALDAQRLGVFLDELGHKFILLMKDSHVDEGAFKILGHTVCGPQFYRRMEGCRPSDTTHTVF